MQISANQPDYKNDPGLQSPLREQQNALLSPSRRPLPAQDQSPAPSSAHRGGSARAYAYSSYSSQNEWVYAQAIRAYQEAARFQENDEGVSSGENSFGNTSFDNEKYLTNIIRTEQGNSTAWSALGVLYYTQGKRDKVSAIYQILQSLDSAKANAFATQLRLHEKMLFTVV